ncbi:MAG TPA: hypothetical protein VES66_11320 [Terriglobales bacterium]|nr:hypothetical protein [Terriglobales bacterium]
MSCLGHTLGVLVLCCASTLASAAAQQSAPAVVPQAPVEKASAPPAHGEQEIEKKEQSQRILGVVPMFAVTSRQNAPPLTPRQKFHLTAKQITDPFTFVAAGLQAGLSQATDEFSGYGQGATGYGKRYGATFADQASGQFFSNFFYPTLLKEDPRYFRGGEGSIKHRIGYALAQEFVCHTDKGGRSFNWSNALGAVTTGGLSNAYYPSKDRGFGLTMSRSGIALLYGSAGGLVQEFWPDIQRKVFHKEPKLPQAP